MWFLLPICCDVAIRRASIRHELSDCFFQFWTRANPDELSELTIFMWFMLVMAISVFKSAVTSIPLFDFKVSEISSFFSIWFFAFGTFQMLLSRESFLVTFGNLAIEIEISSPDMREKKFNVCMCVCLCMYVCVSPYLAMWMTLSTRDIAP